MTESQKHGIQAMHSREADSMQMLSVQDVAQMLSVSVKTVRRMVDRGEIPCVRIGQQLRIHPSNIERLINGKHQTAS